ncbi:MAG: SpoIIIAH-like family protein [Christensenellales bacterium]|nr:SpoIIIAH-like family protein [Christensenellales bacterium]
MKKVLRVGTLILAMAGCFWAGSSFRAVERKLPEKRAAVSDSYADPIEQFKTERAQLRQMQISQLNDVIYGGKADAEVVSLARKQLLDLMAWQEMETTIEGVLRMRGMESSVVTVHTDSVNVLIRDTSLNRQQTSVILELVQRETGISGGNVKIIPIN